MNAYGGVALLIGGSLILILFLFGAVHAIRIAREHRQRIAAIRAEVTANLARIRAGEPGD